MTAATGANSHFPSPGEVFESILPSPRSKPADRDAGASALTSENMKMTADAADQACPDMTGLIAGVEDASTLLKAMGHDGRLMILCHLRSGPKSVTELENLLSARQAIVSQQLARLRLEGLVSARREGQAISYSPPDQRATEMTEVLSRLYLTNNRG